LSVIIDEEDLLLRQAGKGDVSAYRKLVMRYMDYCVRFGERMLGNRQDAEDVAQEVCLKIWREAGKWQRQAKFSTWLYRVMFNACIDYKRRVVRFPGRDLPLDTADGAPDPEAVLLEKQTAKQVMCAMQKLPERQRAAVVLSYYEGMANQDAAGIMELELGAFQQLLYRARQNLKMELNDDREVKGNGREAQ
jgi:RNA polymerase sigma-70 factor (ECF subfamily)